MKPAYVELPSAAQAAYGELFEAAHSLETRRSIASLSGSFQAKTIKGKLYWYFAFRDAFDGRVRQLYLGPDSPAVTALRERADNTTGSDLLRGHVRAAIAHGCSKFSGKHFRILRQLGDSQLFRAGGLLIDTYAFVALGNVLGVRWASGTSTLDIDFAHPGPGANLALALPADMDADVHSAIESLGMGFLPSLTLDGKASATYVSTSDPGLRLDFLTSMRRRDKPLLAPNLGVCLQPMKFLDYLMDQSVQGVIMADAGAVVVNLPDPARYAMHKLLVAGERPTAERVKAAKDVAQSGMLMEYLLDHLPESAMEAWDAVNQRGPKWRQRVNQSMDQLAIARPDTHARWLGSL